MCVIRFICYVTMGNQHQINMKGELLPSSPYGYNSNNPKESRVSSSKITHVVLFIIVILAVLFFISGLLHLLIRFLTKRPSPAQSNRGQEYSSSDTLQRQLHHLFDLHDSGLDQAFIDALPVFPFKEISGPKEPFDCAVCLCEFSETDELRLLPICSHAFHINCIDTWLLSNSTCPICRGTPLIPGFSYANPVFDYDDIREEEEQGSLAYAENGYSNVRRLGIEENTSVFPVRLGKFRRLNDAGGVRDESSSSSALDARRCYSMGSYQYVVGNAELRVTLSQGQMGRVPNLVEGVDQACSSSTLDARRCYSMDSHQYVVGYVEHRVASSQEKMGRGRGRGPNFVEGADQECSGSTLDARRCYSMGSHDTLNGGQTGRGLNHVALDGSGEGREICVGSKSSSYSVSKIWLWSKKGEFQVKNKSSPDLVDVSWIHRTESR